MSRARHFTVKVTGDIQKAIRKFRSKYEDAEIKPELNKRTHFTKPSLVKRKQRQEAIRNRKRNEL